MKRFLLILILFPGLLLSQSAGSAGFSFLKIGFGARNIAMGDLGVVGGNDISSVNYNPAVITKLNNAQIMLGHNSWIQDLRSEVIGASFSALGLPLAFTLNTTSVNDIEVRTRPGDAESTFDAHYFYSGLTSGFSLYNNISAGITIKYVYENLFSDEATGLGYDFGLHITEAIKNLDLGLSVRNLGSVNKLRNESTELPVDVRLGASYKYNVESLNSKLLAIAGFQKYTAADNSHIHTGAEFLYDELIALRLGYISGYDSKDISAGIGIYWNNVNFDYAFTNFNYNLGGAHTISLMYTFN
jgi:hypothetical protein